MKTWWRLWIPMLALLAAGASGRAAQPLTLQNETLAVEVDAAAGTFSLTALAQPGGPAKAITFVKDGRLAAAGGTAKLVKPVGNAGQGGSIEVAYPDGRRDTFLLVQGLPFVLFRAALHNGTGAAQVVNHVAALTAPLELGQPVEKLAVLGTGGLERVEDGALKYVAGNAAPRKKKPARKKADAAGEAKQQATAKGGAPKPLETPKPTFSIPKTAPGDELGSYVWMAVAEPESRAGVVGAWLSQDRASGVVFPRVKEGRLALEAQLHYGCLRLEPGQEAVLETFALGYFADARLGLEAWADAVAREYNIKLPAQPVGMCTWYMDKYAGASDPQHLAELSKVAKEKLAPFGFNFVQIDDGWQAGQKKNGPKKNFNDVDPKAKYAAGMKPVAEQIKTLGLTPGIWFMPFAGNQNDPFFADKQELFVKTQDGKPYETSWGGTCMDMTNPKARAYLAQMVRRISAEWGYELFKMDGMWTGTGTQQIYVNNGYKEDGMGDAVFHDPKMTNIEAYRTGIKTVREAAGSNVFLLGCCVSQNMRSFGGAFGLVDAFRIGPDTGSGHIGSPHASRNYFLNGRVWYNDPDCVAVRAKYPIGNARANASFTAISGNLFYNSDWIPDLPEERLDILKRTMLPHGLKGRPVDLFEQPVARLWLLSDTRAAVRRDVLAFFNWDTKNAATIEATLEHIGLDPKREYVAFDFWENKYLGTVKGKISATVPADSCAILAVKAVEDQPQVLSTSFHVTQGMVDVKEEKWDAERKTLSGVSQVVAGDPYELRIAVPAGWQVQGATALAGNMRTAQVKTDEPQSEPGLARVRLTATESGLVRWAVRFAK